MRTKTATVWEGGARGTATLTGGPRLDTPAWFAWLDAPTTRSFAYPIYNAPQGYIEAFMTLRKEHRQRGGAYWVAYSHVGGCLRKAYVGRSPAVTQVRLQAIAATFLERIQAAAPRPEAPATSATLGRATMHTREDHDNATRPC